MNVADSNGIGAMLFRRGFVAVDNPALADLLVVNTCSVREHAEKRALAKIAEFSGLKKRSAQLWVIGCMAQRLGESLKKEVPGINRVIGAKSIETIEALIEEVYHDHYDHPTGPTGLHEATAFVSIIRGCDNYCAYCIVPYVRGHEISIPGTTIIEQIRQKADRGIREITLLGQNVNSYSDSDMDFPDLLMKVAEIEGIERVRFMTSHPKDCSEKLIRTIAQAPKCCRHIHLPVQAGSDRVLSAMNRRYTAADYRDRIGMIREYLPDADITTDILVGFPGETADDFELTLDLIRDVRFTTAFMFAYSVREGTAAAAMADTVSHPEKLERLRRLIDIQTMITREVYAATAGKKVHLMISGRQEKRERLWMATDSGCKRALIACDTLQAGTILDAMVVKTSGMTLICERGIE
jgi:tRNA-2-methylthio-N6-dimethylallyladenosine synthase